MSETLKKLVLRVWNSPTITTWGSIGTRTFSLVLVLPLILRRFPAAEFNVWCLFSTIIGLQMLAELGFGVTFARIVAYAMGGASGLSQFKSGRELSSTNQPNLELLLRILATMRAIYFRLSIGLVVALAVGGTWALWVPAARVQEPGEIWLAWSIVALCTYVSFRGNLFGCFLQGTNNIALVRRWETAFALGSILSSIIVLSLNGGLLALVIANQIWVAFAAWRNRYLVRQIHGGRYRDLPAGKIDREVFEVVWPAAWRSGIGAFMSLGLVQLSGVFVAQSRDVDSANSYLLALRIVQAVNQFAMAPFYSQLPTLAKLYASGDTKSLLAVAARGMGLAYWSFMIPCTLFGAFGPTALELIKSQTRFPDLDIWVLLCAGFFVERYGAMHIQMYSLTNRVIWHVANGVTGSLMILVWSVGVPLYGIVAIPAGTLIAYLSFYAWFASRINHRHYRLQFPHFDLGCLLRVRS